jgi:WD40 repeat protein
VDPPSLNNCVEIQQFSNNMTNWGITQVAFSPDGQYLATGDQSGNTKLWNMNGKTATAAGHTLPSGTNGNMIPAFSPNGMLIAAGTSNGGLSMWSVGGNWNKKGDFIGNPALSDVAGVAFTPDSSQVVIVDYDTSTMQTFSASTLMMAGSRTLTSKPESLAIAQAPSGSALWAAVGLQDGTVAVYNLNAAPTQAPLTALVSSADDANVVALNHDGSLLAVGGGILDTRITLWNVSTAGLTPHAPAPNLGTNAEGGVAGLAFAPDGRNLVVAYGYHTPVVSIYEVATGQNHGTAAPMYSPLGATFSPRGDVVVAGEAFNGWTIVCGD